MTFKYNSTEEDIMNHYDSKYFKYQKIIGEFGGKANIFKFEKYIKNTDNVVDFGCGGGYLLKNLQCKQKIGVEINDAACKTAQENRINRRDCRPMG